jgi:putative toxin-antitoxin system antitoxin component (TIGR02293 family)
MTTMTETPKSTSMRNRAGRRRDAPHREGASAARSFQAALLSLAQPEPAQAIRFVKRGFPVSWFDSLQKSLGVSRQRLTEIVRIAPRTLARRRRAGRLSADESDRVLRFWTVLGCASRVLGNVEQARGWLTTPNWALGDKTPLEYADTEPGAREVEHLLGRIEHGVFS